MEAALARQIAMYLAHTVFSWSMSRVGAAFDRDRTTASHACHRVEDLRDDAQFDSLLLKLESCARAAPLFPETKP
jgi:chromosomal replication initiation ATPase DnaA